MESKNFLLNQMLQPELKSKSTSCPNYAGVINIPCDDVCMEIFHVCTLVVFQFLLFRPLDSIIAFDC